MTKPVHIPLSQSFGAKLMRVAVFADVHGNSDALRAVLAEIDAAAPDVICNLGDVFSGPLDAAGVAEILLARPDIHTVCGNHDRYLITQDGADMGPSDHVAFNALGGAALNWIRDLPKIKIVEDMFLCHATPQSDSVYWLEAVTAAGEVTPRSLAEIATKAKGITQKIILCAHTHLPRLVHLPDGRIILNPGSVGCPAYDDTAPVPHVVENGTPDASWAMLETGALPKVTFYRTPYDTTAMSEAARANGRPAWACAVATGWLHN